MLQEPLKRAFLFHMLRHRATHQQKIWLALAYRQDLPSFSIDSVQSGMDIRLEWVDMASSMIIKDVRLQDGSCLKSNLN